MRKYIHHVSGIFSHRETAESARLRLIDNGMPESRVTLFDNASKLPPATEQAKSNAVLKNMIVKGVIGTAVGTGIGAIAEVALVAASATLFVVSPLVAPLALLGWGATLGGTVGATIGAKLTPNNKKSWLTDLARDSIASGQVILVVETLTQKETDTSTEVIKLSVNNYQDVSIS